MAKYCVNGHLKEGDNLYILKVTYRQKRKDGSYGVYKTARHECVTCKRAAQARYTDRKKTEYDPARTAVANRRTQMSKVTKLVEAYNAKRKQLAKSEE